MSTIKAAEPIESIETNYRKQQIRNLAVKKLVSDNPDDYVVSQWELDILQLGISFCYNVTRMGELIERNEKLTKSQQHLRAENLDFANTITTMLNRNLSDDEHEKIRKQMDEYWELQSETKRGG